MMAVLGMAASLCATSNQEIQVHISLPAMTAFNTLQTCESRSCYRDSIRWLSVVPNESPRIDPIHRVIFHVLVEICLEYRRFSDTIDMSNVLFRSRNK
jgi:hypothetical protein